MTKKILTAFLALAALAVAAFGAEQELRGRVISVADGDTITIADALDDRHKIRLDAIDAPEKAQPYGPEAAARLEELLSQLGGVVMVRVKDKDKYGRTVGRVFAVVDINELMVREGLAFRYAEHDKWGGGIKRAEDFARAHKLGVWKQPNGGVRPWDFRHGRRVAAPAPAAPEKEMSELDALFHTEYSDARVAYATGSAAPAAEEVYWVTKSSGKVHNKTCRYFGVSKGYTTKKPTGPNCRVCGGTEAPRR